jgi:hypothetical protein
LESSKPGNGTGYQGRSCASELRRGLIRRRQRDSIRGLNRTELWRRLIWRRQRHSVGNLDSTEFRRGLVRRRQRDSVRDVGYSPASLAGERVVDRNRDGKYDKTY